MVSDVDVVTRWYEAIAERRLDTLRDLADPQIEFIVPDAFPSGGRYVGHQSVFDGFFRESAKTWSELTPCVDEVIDGDSAVVVRGRYVGRTAVTDIAFDVPFAHVWRVASGKLVFMQQYVDTALLRDCIEGRLRGKDL